MKGNRGRSKTSKYRFIETDDIMSHPDGFRMGMDKVSNLFSGSKSPDLFGLYVLYDCAPDH